MCIRDSFSGDITIADKIIHTGDTDTAIRFPAADTIRFEVGNQQAVHILPASAGSGGARMGMGTNNPTGMLHIYGSNPPFRIQNSNDSANLQMGMWDQNNIMLQASNRPFKLATETSHPIVFHTGGLNNERLEFLGDSILSAIVSEELINKFPLEERIYRLRCVEAWSMVVPWIGFELNHIIKLAEPTHKAKFIAFESVYDPENLPGQKRNILAWPYREGLRLDEARNPLTILSVGLYGRILPNQNGSPIRLIVPWKYGFKSIKSITKISFVEKMPDTSWNLEAPNEYGFYSNVNPYVSHPRWSQKRERRIGEFRTVSYTHLTLPTNREV